MNAATEKMTNLGWLTQIGLKAIEYSADPKSTGEEGPSWEDRCGAIASAQCLIFNRKSIISRCNRVSVILNHSGKSFDDATLDSIHA